MSFDGFDELIKLAMTWGISALGGLALIVAGLLVARLVRTALTHALRRLRLDNQLIEVLTSLAYYLAVAVVVIAAFGIVGIETASLIPILGTCTLAIGLALQGSLSNFASGIMLLIFRPFRKGDLIESGDYVGHVTEIGVVSTKIDSLQNVRVIIPNTYIPQRPLQNWTRNGTCRIDLKLEVAIESDLSKVKEAITRSLIDHARVLDDPAPFVGVENFGDSSCTRRGDNALEVPVLAYWRDCVRVPAFHTQRYQHGLGKNNIQEREGTNNSGTTVLARLAPPLGSDQLSPFALARRATHPFSFDTLEPDGYTGLCAGRILYRKKNIYDNYRNKD